LPTRNSIAAKAIHCECRPAKELAPEFCCTAIWLEFDPQTDSCSSERLEKMQRLIREGVAMRALHKAGQGRQLSPEFDAWFADHLAQWRGVEGLCIDASVRLCGASNNVLYHTPKAGQVTSADAAPTSAAAGEQDQHVKRQRLETGAAKGSPPLSEKKSDAPAPMNDNPESLKRKQPATSVAASSDSKRSGRVEAPSPDLDAPMADAKAQSVPIESDARRAARLVKVKVALRALKAATLAAKQAELKALQGTPKAALVANAIKAMTHEEPRELPTFESLRQHTCSQASFACSPCA
jgi:hypothetical protein